MTDSLAWDAGHGPRVRCRASRRTRGHSGARGATRAVLPRAIASTPPTAPRGATSASGSTASRRSGATSAWPSSGCCAPARPRRRCGWRSRSHARCPGTHTRMRSGAGWHRRSTRRRHCPPSDARRASTGTACWRSLEGLFDEARISCEAALAAAREAHEPSVEAATLTALGRCAVLVADPDAVAVCGAAGGRRARRR